MNKKDKAQIKKAAEYFFKDLAARQKKCNTCNVRNCMLCKK